MLSNSTIGYTVDSSAVGNGVIMHLGAEVGLVVVDRSTVSVNAGHIMLSFGGYPADLAAHIRFLHPLHNFAILSFDPRELSAEVSPPTHWFAVKQICVQCQAFCFPGSVAMQGMRCKVCAFVCMTQVSPTCQCSVIHNLVIPHNMNHDE